MEIFPKVKLALMLIEHEIIRSQYSNRKERIIYNITHMTDILVYVKQTIYVWIEYPQFISTLNTKLQQFYEESNKVENDVIDINILNQFREILDEVNMLIQPSIG